MRELTLKYDPLTIKHLGVSLYSQLPSVFSELVSNAYDADADNVRIELTEGPQGKEIYISDDGHGMALEEIDEKYLMVGRNRRDQGDTAISPKKNRPVIGKKGLGKLSVFGVCTEIVVRTVRDGLENSFSMDLKEIERLKGEYHPKIISQNTNTTDASGTEIWLKKIKRKSPFDLNLLAKNLAKRFIIFDEMRVQMSLNGTDEVILTNEMKFSELDIEFQWDFPSDFFDKNYDYWNLIKGKILTPKTPVRDTSMRGIYLVSRGKIVNEPEFYGARDNDLVHTYITGYLSVDFIDEFDEDIISTDRHSLIWENDRASELRTYLQHVVRKLGADWNKKRSDKKTASIAKSGNIDVNEWKKGLVSYERTLAEKIINPVLEDPLIDVEKSARLIGNVIEKFDNKSFKDYASDLAERVAPTELPRIIELMEEWKITEAKELSALATARVEVITKFEQLLSSDTKEVPTLHNFLKQFSWLLDPRVLEFQDEVTYSKLLKETYPEEELEESDRRIDFLCSNTLGGILYVIEIKRSKYVVDKKALEQAYDYGAFLKDKFASASGFSKVVCYVVGGQKSSETIFRSKEQTYMSTGEVFVKTYRELLEQSKIFHREFIDAKKQYQ
ncbi:ATP-binding protein [Roseibium sp.]|uniref:ATP-binding protein n=1 Tax=Roseibium sp. TaxID=1936156 RepID=UPI003A971F06